MSDHLFVFGTLLSGYDHPMARRLAREAELIGAARCRGCLYLVRHYPGMVLSTDAADQVFGELYRMRDAAALLHTLDAYEGCAEGATQPTEYVRDSLSASRSTTAARSRPGPMFITGRWRTCRGSHRESFWSISALFFPSPLVGEGALAQRGDG